MRQIFMLIIFGLIFVLKAQEISLNGQHYIKSEGQWYRQDSRRLWKVNPEVITVKYREDAMQENISAFINERNLRVLHTNEQGYVDLQVPEGVDPIELSRDFMESGLVTIVFPDTYGILNASPSDPLFSSQWFHQRADDHDIDTPEAWNLETGDSSVIVAVLDTEIDIDHEDLSGVIISSTDLVGDPIDGLSHGTEVTGIIAAKTNNNTGVAGLAGGWHPNSGVRILHYKVTYRYGWVKNHIVDEAINQAKNAGADIINMSFSTPENPDIADAILSAYNAGIFLVAATGNADNEDIYHPAESPYVFAVGASNQEDKRARWIGRIECNPSNPTQCDTSWGGSNYGEGLDVVAPGITILSTRYDDEYAPPDTGTSFATPQVAGIAALLKSYNASLTNADIEEIIASTAEKVGGYNYDQTKEYGSWNNEMGYGRVNAYAALASIPPENLTLENMSIGYDTVFTATNSITAGPNFTVESTGDMTFQAGNVITLKPGFTATVGSKFHAYIDEDLGGGLGKIIAAVPDVKGIEEHVPEDENDDSLPAAYSLSPAYPNPFNPVTTIPFSLPEASEVSIVVYDILGREVMRWDRQEPPGYRSLVWNGTDRSGRLVPSGIYLYRLVATSTESDRRFTTSKKMLLLK